MLHFSLNVIKEGHMSCLSMLLLGTSALLIGPTASQVPLWPTKVHSYVAVRSGLTDRVDPIVAL